MPAENKLKEQRELASRMSFGQSSDNLYQMALKQFPVHWNNILDFGAGKGHFSKLVLKENPNRQITAIDLMDRPADLPQEIQWLKQDLNEPLTDPQGPFDVVTAIEVIEHLENPRLVARTWKSLLRPGGTLIFSTPNNESLRAMVSLVVRGHYVEFNDTNYPAHITALLKKDINRILSEAGFKSWDFFYSNRGAIPKWTRLTWQTLSGGLLIGKRFSDNVFVRAIS